MVKGIAIEMDSRSFGATQDRFCGNDKQQYHFAGAVKMMAEINTKDCHVPKGLAMTFSPD